MTAKKKRRRVERPSDAIDYDRTADRNAPSDARADDDRMVIFDSELGTDDELIDDPQLTEADYHDQRPPHYGE